MKNLLMNIIANMSKFNKKNTYFFRKKKYISINTNKKKDLFNSNISRFTKKMNFIVY